MPGTANSGGRNRKSAQQHRLEGSYRRDRHAASDVPDVPKGRPTLPKALKGEALAEWHRMLHRLELARTLSLIDDAVLCRYCQLHARAERLEKQVAALKSAFYVDHLGNEKVHPAFAQLRSHDQTLRGYLVEFGLTPAARSRVKATDVDPPADPFAEFEAGDAEPTH